MKNQERIFGLDIVRAFAIIFVLFGHGEIYIKDYINSNIYDFFTLDGVSLFFVLSGFLIGGILIKTIEAKKFGFAELWNFWLRRWFRTLPNYILILTTLLLIKIVLFKSYPADAWQYYLFIQNLYKQHPLFFPEAWSLAVEEWFYLLIPFVVMGCFALWTRVKNKNVIAGVIISVMIFCTGFRALTIFHNTHLDYEAWDLTVRKIVFSRLDSIVFGLLGAYLSYYHNRIWMKYKVPLLIAGIALLFVCNFLFIALQETFFRDYLMLPLNGIAALMIIPFMSKFNYGPVYIRKPILFISTISYSMYLINLSLIEITVLPMVFKHLHFDVNANGVHAFIAYGVFFVVTIAVSYLIYHFYEIKITSLRDKFSKKEPHITTPMAIEK